MKSLPLRILETVLRFMARAVLWKYRPRVVGITGSVGKSSAKEAVTLALSPAYQVGTNPANYNNEIGLPLTVIGAPTGGRSVIGWLKVGLRWLWLMLWPARYPSVLVLEMGVDRPGDMRYLLGFIPVSVGVVTDVSGSHLEFFGTLKAIAREKGEIVKHLAAAGTAVLNADNPLTAAMADKTKADTVILFGFGEKADLKAENVVLVGDEAGHPSLSFKVSFGGQHLPVRLPHVLARHHAYAALAALAVATAFKVNLVEAARSLARLEPLPGRLKPFAGRNHSLILDDTYNASPVSLAAALDVFADLPAKRRLVALGDMLELGPDSAARHREVGERLAALKVDQAFLVGERMREAASALREAGYPENRYAWLPDPVSAGNVLEQVLQPGDVVLVKGSQGMRMEKTVERLLADLDRDQGRLCRQSPVWRKKPFIHP